MAEARRRQGSCARSRPRLASRASSRRAKRRGASPKALRARAPRPSSVRSRTAEKARPRCSTRAWRGGSRAGRIRAPARGADLGAGGRDGRPPERRRDPARPAAARRAERLRAAVSASCIAAAGECPRLLVGLGGTATMDGGEGLLEVLDQLPAPTTVLCDTRATLTEAPARFGPQKGASPEEIGELEERFRGRPCGGASRLGRSGRPGRRACVARRRARTGRAVPVRADRLPRARRAAPISSSPARAPSTGRRSRARRRARRCGVCDELGVRCVLFGGRVERRIEAVALSGDPSRATADLEELGLRLGLA